MCVHEPWLSRSAAFNACSHEFQVELGMQLELRVYAQAETFGDLLVFYILHHGVLTKTVKLKIMLEGSIWGEDFILEDISLLEDPTAYCLTYAEVLSVRKASLDQILVSFPQDAQVLYYHARWLAVQRGLMRY